MGKNREKKYINSIVVKKKVLGDISGGIKSKNKSDSDQKNDTNGQQIQNDKENDKTNVNNKKNIQDAKKNETTLSENKNVDENDKTNDVNNGNIQNAEKNEVALINENKNAEKNEVALINENKNAEKNEFALINKNKSADGNDDDDDDDDGNITEINFILSMKKIIRKKSISQYNIKNIITYILNEYSGCNLFDLFLNILSLNKMKPIWHLASMMYNLHLNPTKSIASAILLCYSLSEI